MSPDSSSLPDHILRPHLRPVQPVPMQRDGRKFIALRDPAMLQKETMVISMPAMQLLQHFHGRQTLEELAHQFSTEVDQLTQLAQRLDTLGLLWGPTFEKMETERKAELKSAGAFPPRASKSLGDDEAACRAALDAYFEQAEDPEIEETAIAIVAPHLDYDRGWPNYAGAYFALRDRTPPDRVVVLGTNHFGLGTDGVVLSQLGVDTPIGSCRPDEEVVSRLVDTLGRPVIIDELDHLPEHSIELQVPWLQYCFGDVPIVTALIPDPIGEVEEDSTERVPARRFITALREILDDLGGVSFFVASSDLSHVGPQFGEPRPVDEQRRIDVERHDREMMAKFITGDPDEFVAAMRWNKNPTRWCGVGNMTALLSLVDAARVELVDYRQAYDERGMALVSSAAMVLT